jgi:hypothetical protein
MRPQVQVQVREVRPLVQVREVQAQVRGREVQAQVRGREVQVREVQARLRRRRRCALVCDVQVRTAAATRRRCSPSGTAQHHPRRHRSSPARSAPTPATPARWMQPAPPRHGSGLRSAQARWGRSGCARPSTRPPQCPSTCGGGCRLCPPPLAENYWNVPSSVGERRWNVDVGSEEKNI